MMKNSASKRALAILMSLVMLLSLFPAAFAEEEDTGASLDASDYQDNWADTLDDVYVLILATDYTLTQDEIVEINDVIVTGGPDGLTYKWTSSNNSVARVSGNGDSAVVTPVGPGEATITLTVTRTSDGSSDSDSVQVTVEADQPTQVSAAANGSTNITINAGDSLPVSVTASGGSGQYTYVWEDSDGALAVNTTGSGAGNTIYGRHPGAGSVTVTVIDTQVLGNYAQVTWSGTVKEVSTPLRASLSQTQMTLTAGQSTSLTLTASGGSGDPGNYQYFWKSDNTKVASIDGSGSTVTVNAAGILSGLSGTAQISAAVYDSVTQTTSETVYCNVVVKNGEATYNAVASAAVGSNLPVDPIANSIAQAYAENFGQTLSYSASVRFFSPSSSAGVLQLQDGTQVVSVNSYSYAAMQDMLFHPLAAGTFLTNYSISDNGNVISGSISIAVSGGSAITDVTMNPASMSMSTYSTMYLTLNVTPAGAAYTVSWASGDTRIATVAGSGNVVTIASQGNTGTTNVVATVTDSTGATISRTVPVSVSSGGGGGGGGGGGSSYRTYNPSMTITIGSDYYGTEISDSIAKQWRSSFGITLGDDARLRFSSVGTTRYGELRLSNGYQVQANTNYTFLDLRGMYFEPYAAGTFTIPYSMTYRGDEMRGSFQISIRATNLNVTMNPTDLSMTPFSNRSISLNITPSSAYYRVNWSTSNSSVATVTGNGASATVYAQGQTGTASITATVTDANGINIYRSCSVRVSGNASSNYDPTITIPLGIIYTGTGTADAMISQFRNVYGVSLDVKNATIRFSSMGDSRVGVLHMPNGTAAKINTSYTLDQYRNSMYVEPVSAGTYRLPYTLTYNGKTLTGVASFVISTSAVNCTLNLPDTLPYVFSSPLNGSAGGSTLNNSISNAVGSAWTYVRFTDSSENTGTLYLNSGKAALTPTTNVTSQAMNQLYFVPTGPGTFSVPFIVYSNSGKLADGTLNIIVPGSAASTFTDVPANAYYADAVTWALQNEITTGTSATTFSPNNSVTRGQAVTFLWRAMGRPTVSNTYNPFKDVAPDEYYTQAVLWAVQQGITKGTSETTFSPNATLAQDQMLTFLCRASGVSASGSDWSGEAMSWAQGRGLFDGRPGVPNAKDPCPRCDVVFYLWKNAM